MYNVYCTLDQKAGKLFAPPPKKEMHGSSPGIINVRTKLSHDRCSLGYHIVSLCCGLVTIGKASIAANLRRW